MQVERVMMKRLIVIMGVSGSGKSTISCALGQRLNVTVIEGDAFHPETNIQKMAGGRPLDDVDRKAWLVAINQNIERQVEPDLILACSALTPFVQRALQNIETRKCVWILLEGSPELIRQRLESRQGHFMKAALLDSQFEALNCPKNCHRVLIDKPVKRIVDNITAILARLDNKH